MKKLIALICIIVVSLFLSGCGNTINYVAGAKVGDYVNFGKFNGTPIMWRVLAEKKDGRKLLVSEYGIDSNKNVNTDDKIWEKSKIRSWLNNEFYTNSFSDDEKKIISVTENLNVSNSKYDIFGGKTTKDKIFLLSIDEVESHMQSAREKLVVPTEFALANGVVDGSKYISILDKTTIRRLSKAQKKDRCYNYYQDACCWLLRTSGANFVKVGVDGNISQSSGKDIAIRPAIWVMINDELKKNAINNFIEREVKRPTVKINWDEYTGFVCKYGKGAFRKENGVEYMTYIISDVQMCAVGKAKLLGGISNGWSTCYPNGTFVKVAIGIHNYQSDAIMVSASMFDLIDMETGYKYSYSTEGQLAYDMSHDRNKSFFRLNPGQTEAMTIVYDVPPKLLDREIGVRGRGGMTGQSIIMEIGNYTF